MSEEWNAALEGAATIVENTLYMNRNIIAQMIREMKRPSVGMSAIGTQQSDGIPMPPPNQP